MVPSNGKYAAAEAAAAAGRYDEDTNFSILTGRKTIGGKLSSTELALMTPHQREKYERTRQAKRRKVVSMQRFLCSVVLKPETHELLRQAAMDKGVDYDKCIYESVRHYMSCLARFEEQD
jgi:hypothetical protein